MTKFAYPPAVVFSAYIFFLILFVAAAVLLGMWIVARRRDKERERLELENARLMCRVEHYKREHRDTVNKYADAANEAARLKGGKHETPNQNQSHRRG
jgi:hypothetical protein